MPGIIKSVLNFIITDPIRKIFAIIFAFGLWFFVAIDTNYQYSKNIAVTYTNLPDTYVLVDSVLHIKVTFSGQGRTLFNIWASPPKAVCPLSEIKLGENNIPTSELTIPVKDVEVSYEQRFLKLKVDEKLRKQMRLSVPIKGSLKEGYSLSGIYILDTVIATGPKSIIGDLNEMPTESLDLKNQSTSFERELRVRPFSQLIQLSKDVVLAKIEVEATIETVLTDLPVRIIKEKHQIGTIQKLQLDTLIISGAGGRIRRLEKGDISIRINITKLGPGEYMLPAEIILPEYIKPVYSSPQRFKIKLY